MKYKRRPQTYEKVFTSETYLNLFNPLELQTDYHGGPQEYTDKFRSLFRDFDLFFFQLVVQYYWMQRRFIFNNKRKEHDRRSFPRTDAAYSTFIKHHIGSNYQLFTTTFVFSKVLTYLHDFFGKDMDKHNPYEEPEFYEFPYKNISIAHLTLVYQMDERLDLLKEAEKGKMSYYEFIDFVINYTYCVNDEMDRQVFTLYRPLNNTNFYIQNHFRKGITIGLGKSVRSQKSIRRKPCKPYEYKNYETKTSDLREHEVQ